MRENACLATRCNESPEVLCLTKKLDIGIKILRDVRNLLMDLAGPILQKDEEAVEQPTIVMDNLELEAESVYRLSQDILELVSNIRSRL